METWQMIVAVCAGLITLFTLLEKLWKYTRPVAQADKDIKGTTQDVGLLKTSFDELQKRVTKIELHQDNALVAIRDHAQANRVVCNALLALLDHELSGNHTAQLEEAKDKIQTYLIER